MNGSVSVMQWLGISWKSRSSLGIAVYVAVQSQSCMRCLSLVCTVAGSRSASCTGSSMLAQVLTHHDVFCSYAFAIVIDSLYLICSGANVGLGVEVNCGWTSLPEVVMSMFSFLLLLFLRERSHSSASRGPHCFCFVKIATQ